MVARRFQAGWPAIQLRSQHAGYGADKAGRRNVRSGGQSCGQLVAWRCIARAGVEAAAGQRSADEWQRRDCIGNSTGGAGHQLSQHFPRFRGVCSVLSASSSARHGRQCACHAFEAGSGYHGRGFRQNSCEAAIICHASGEWHTECCCQHACNKGTRFSCVHTCSSGQRSLGTAFSNSNLSSCSQICGCFHGCCRCEVQPRCYKIPHPCCSQVRGSFRQSGVE